MFDTLVYVLLILIWPLCLFIIGLVLLQGGAGDMSSAFGGGGQLDSTLGVGAGRKMSKLTGWLVFSFLVIVTILAVPHGSIAKRAAETAGVTGPASTAPAGDKPAAATPSEEAKPIAPVDGVSPAPVIDPAAPTAPAPAAPADQAPAVPAPAAPAPAAVPAPEAQAPAVPAPAAVPAAPAAAVPGAPAPAANPEAVAPAPAAPAEAPVAPKSKLLPE